MKVAIIGTGFAAKLRAEALVQDDRSQLVAVVGRDRDRTTAFARQWQAESHSNCTALLEASEPDLIFVSTINRDHAAITRQALEAGKHVVVEYPLALDLAQARSLVALARSRNLLLHVEHVELLSGPHLALKVGLPALGRIFYAESVTFKAVNPAPDRWSYRPAELGFPLVGALSRIHRFMDLFGAVERVACQARFWGDRLPECFTSCLCTAQLQFASGVVADIKYGKGDAIWQARRTTEIRGSQGAMILDGDRNVKVTATGAEPIAVGSRRGLFARDTRNVIDCLLEGDALYTEPESSLRSLEVALAAERSALTKQTVTLPLDP